VPVPEPAPQAIWRVLTLVSVAIHDSTVATWDAKYAYDRPPPNTVDPTLRTAVATPRSPSYPSEHAAIATAAADVLGWLFPEQAEALAQKAESAGRSRIVAGVAYPSDVEAGTQLGHRVAAAVIEHAKSDGSDAPWTGTMPTGPQYWTGKDPRLITMGTWQPWVLSSPDQFRPAPPPPFNSPQQHSELSEVKNFQNTFETRRAAFFWAPPGIKEWLAITNRKIFEYRLDDNPPRAARAVSLLMAATFDSMIGCFEAKYHYWAARPFQLDPTITPLFPTPNHPTYPSAHACNDAAAAVVLSYLFPGDADFFWARAEEGAESRLWAGIHFRSDLDAGMKLGRSVGEVVVARAKQDEALQ
jgi:membrane-associated phospholipid phosphatase